MLHEALKQATKPNHDQLEQLMFVNEIMNGSLTLQQYRQILVTNYLVHKTFEDYLFDNLSPEIAGRLQIENRKKLAALEADLDELGLEPPELEHTTPQIEKTDAAILGAMYVLEGATLGGNVIVKRLKVNPQLASHNLNFN